MRSITTGVSHLYRADPSSGHQAPMLLRDDGGCDDGSAARRTCPRALSSLADSDPKARSALRIRKEGKSIACRHGQAWPESANLCILSERLTLVTATSIGQSLLQLFVCCANNGIAFLLEYQGEASHLRSHAPLAWPRQATLVAALPAPWQHDPSQGQAFVDSSSWGFWCQCHTSTQMDRVRACRDPAPSWQRHPPQIPWYPRGKPAAAGRPAAGTPFFWKA